MTGTALIPVLILVLASSQIFSSRASRDRVGKVPVPREVLTSQRKGTIRGHSKEGVTQPSPSGRAQITAERAPVYRAASDQGTPVAVLQKGTDVWIDFELKDDKASWCNIKRTSKGDDIGYVHCTDLRRVSEGK